MAETLLLLAVSGVAGLMAFAAWRATRDPRVTWGFALRSLAACGALTMTGAAIAIGAAWLLLRHTDGAALDQALVLGFAVFLAAPLEGQRWLPRLETRWYPSMLFRVAEAGLLALVLILVLWGLLAPTHRCFA